MPRHNILVASIDGLRATSLGAYGNTAFATPSLDEFAAESFLLDACYAPAVELTDIYRALWQSLHPLRPMKSGMQVEDLPQYLASRGYATSLITDDPALPAFTTGEFHEIIEGGTAAEHNTPDARAPELAETEIAHLFAAACDAVLSQTRSAPRLVWLHSKGMYGRWDAPLELQQSLREEGDPPPVENAVPPDLTMRGADDPDAVFQYGCAYAAQVMVLDECWKALMAAIDSVRSEDGWLVVLIGARGFPLGEHRRIGGADPRLFGEQLHVPWLIRFPNGFGRLSRSGALTSHFDFFPTIAAGLEEANSGILASVDGMDVSPLARSARAQWREALLSASATSRSIRTSGWCLRQDVPVDKSKPESATEHSGVELYVRPDDRWEANDVAKLCPDMLETLTDAIDDAGQHLLRNEPIPKSVVASSAAETG
ncbi:MAG TPA: sulfatase-like hydrolase/transferase [Lacipirellulaceae bacterium]